MSLIEKETRPLKLADFLGWSSVALGLAEIFAPREVGRLVGVQGNRDLLKIYGAREFLAGLGILVSRQKAPWLWARVVGDALDLATLAPGLNSFRKSRRLASGLAVAAVAGVALLDIYCAAQAQDQR